jgi:hypothetical protein
MLHKLAVFIDQMNYCVQRANGKTQITEQDLKLFNDLHCYISELERKLEIRGKD